MAWTYLDYRAANYGICVGIAVVCTVVMFIVFYLTEKGAEMAQKPFLSFLVKKLDMETKEISRHKGDKHETRRRCFYCPKSDRDKFLSILVWLIGSAALTVVGVVIFHNCILVNQMVTNYNDQSCPGYTMDCFITIPDITELNSMNITASFRCTPWNLAPFPSNQTNITAHCFRWGPPQSTKDVLDQLGICTGILGMFFTILAIIICLGGTKPQLILSILGCLSCTAAIIVIAVLQAAYATLTYALLGFGIAISVFGISFYVIFHCSKSKTDPSNTESQNTQKSTEEDGPIQKTVQTETP